MKFVKEYTVDGFVRASTSGKDAHGKTYWSAAAGQADFLGCSKAKDAFKLGMFGWAEGRAMIEAVKVEIDGKLGVHTKQYVPQYDVSGAYVDVGRFCEGVPECMLTFEEQETPQAGFVWIHVSTGVSGGVSSREIQLHGAAVGALVDALESVGQRVKLTWERSSQANGHSITLWMPLKEYEEPLDLDRLAFFLTHNAPRRVMAWHEYLKAPGDLASSMGVTPGSAACQPWSNPDLFPEADVRVACQHFYNEAGAARWVLEQLKELGITIELGE